jgi:hypothetical protein
MTAIQYVAWFIFMAVAVMTILVVWTLGSAGLLRRPRRRRAAASSDAEMVERLMPRRSAPGPSVGPAQRGSSVDPGTDHERPLRGQVA